jgi:hypothetical protein
MTESAAATSSFRETLADTVVVAGAWVAAFALLVLAAAWVSGTQPGREGATPLDRLGRQLTPNNSNARVQGDAIVVANRPDAPLVILAAGTLPIRAADYGRVVIDADPLPKDVEAALIWVRRDEPGRPHEQRLAQDGSRIVATLLDGNPGWRDEIAFMAVGVKGAMKEPWTLRSFRLEPLGTAGIAADILQGWTSLERWDGRSINVVFGGRDEQRAWLPPLAFAASVIAAFAAWLFARRRGRQATPVLLALPFLLGWLALDARWQANLVEQAGITFREFGGRDLEGRHLAMEDADLFRFTQAAIAKLPEQPVRIYATSDFEYFRRRAGYHLYPHNVLAYNWADPSVMQPGDYVFLYQKADVGYDTGRRLLLWKSGPTLPVTPLAVQRGAGLFQVRAADAPAQ